MPVFATGPDGMPQRVFTTDAAGDRVPLSVEKNKFLNAQNLAQLAKDTSAMEWAAREIVSQDWPVNNHDLHQVAQTRVNALTQTMKPDGFNVGMNLGRAGGAGIGGELVEGGAVLRVAGFSESGGQVGERRMPIQPEVAHEHPRHGLQIERPAIRPDEAGDRVAGPGPGHLEAFRKATEIQQAITLEPDIINQIKKLGVE